MSLIRLTNRLAKNQPAFLAPVDIAPEHIVAVTPASYNDAPNGSRILTVTGVIYDVEETPDKIAALRSLAGRATHTPIWVWVDGQGIKGITAGPNGVLNPPA